MTSQVAITLLKSLEQSLDSYCELNDEGKTAFNMAISALELFGNSEQLPTVEPQKWIPISVKLPEKRQDVIVTVNDGMIYTDTDEWIGTGFFAYGHNVVAWQSLPDPWKGEEE